MTVILELPAEAQARLKAEATRRGITVDQLVTELAAGFPAEQQDRAAGTLDEFFGSGDSGDPSWASRDIHELRADAARRGLGDSA
jgi:hypothetical protein